VNRPSKQQILGYIGDMVTQDLNGPEFVDYLGRFGCEILDGSVKIRGDYMTVVLDHGTSETTLEVTISVKEKVSR
jgi:hypothetical protein